MKWVKHPSFFITYLIILVTGLAIYFQGNHGDLVLFLNQYRQPGLDLTMPYVTALGDGWVFAIITVTLLLIRWRMGLVFGFMGLGQLLISYLLKRQIFKDVPRPRIYFESRGVELDLIPGVKVHGYHSFPSGHTMTAFAIATFFALAFYHRNILGVALILVATLVGFSRIYLSQHFLIDVCVGSILGVILGLIANNYLQARLKNSG